MTDHLSFDPAKSALLCMDYQTAIVPIYAGEQQEELLSRAANVLRDARRAGMRVIYLQVGFRPNLPEVSSRNRLLRAIKESPQHQQIFQGMAGAIHPAIAPEGDDVVVAKHRVSGFVGTDLEMLLRANEIDTLILFGIATSGVVLSTLLQAADADYRLYVIRDCCADLDPELHVCLLDKMFVKVAGVITASEFTTGLRFSQALDGKWQEVLQGLTRGDFSQLEPHFTPDYTAEDVRCHILDYYEQGAFENEPQALAEALTCACFLGRTGIAEYLLQRGVDVTAGIGTGLSAFHWAANRGHLATVQLLLKHNAPLEMRNRYDGTVLGGTLWAALHERLRADHLAIVETLLAAGAHMEPEWQQEIEELRQRAAAFA
jgi:nicotinamidase-related amidase